MEIAKHLHDIAPTRWKNGKGTTRELFRIGAIDNEQDFALRVSVADMDCDSVFSTYPGVDRILMILHGSGMQLIDIPDSMVIATLSGQFSTFSFAGERQLEGRLNDGPIIDLNVMIRRGFATTGLRIIGPSQTEPAGDCRLVLAARGELRVESSDGNELALRDSEFITVTGAKRILTMSNSIAVLVDYHCSA
ncbi:hypothetical protein K788_0000507 [Paraburkholderia caribensis MBA4]|uniref:HutD family protein n=1 Tax=Paraburkholderia caribensis MBA4 TaxID=1323664 RepID=A0A0P0RIK0_9BURK|nr:HutD family protein [Paraburkholderia caribensis]ALL68439.1 hypothetical protein K788_0000507 [Paraburkholderia caribensis MBA4]